MIKVKQPKRRTLWIDPPDAWMKARSRPHRHQILMSSLIRSLRSSLGLTQSQLGSQLGVSGLTVSRWERKNGTHPRRFRLRRVRELWKLVRAMKDEKFWDDRVAPPEFWR